MKKIKKQVDLLKMNKIQLIKKVNKLNVEKNTLENVIKNELYKTFMDKLKEPQEVNRLKKENKNLRNKNKILKSLLKDKNGKWITYRKSKDTKDETKN